MKAKLTEWIGKSVMVSMHGTESQVEGVLKAVEDDYIIVASEDDRDLVAMVFITDVCLKG